MQFLVKWKGYDESHNTWEPWTSLRLVDKLHEYLRKHKMGKIIPKECLGEQTPEPSKHAKKRKRAANLRVRIDESLNEVNEFTTDDDDSTSTRTSRRSSRRNKA